MPLPHHFVLVLYTKVCTKVYVTRAPLGFIQGFPAVASRLVSPSLPPGLPRGLPYDALRCLAQHWRWQRWRAQRWRCHGVKSTGLESIGPEKIIGTFFLKIFEKCIFSFFQKHLIF